MKTQECVKCKIVKDIKDFYKRKTICKVCISVVAKIYYSKNQESRKEYARTYRQKNNTLINIKTKEYYDKNKVKSSKANKKRAKKSALYSMFATKLAIYEEIKRSENDLLNVRCTENACQQWFVPTIRMVENRLRSLNNINCGDGRFYCSDNCKQDCIIYKQRTYPRGFNNDNSRNSQREWAKAVKNRDDSQCVKCGSTENLRAHHIEGLNQNPLMSADIDIGITFCGVCHREVHKNVGCRYIDLQQETCV